jgi:recombination protein RecT
MISLARRSGIVRAIRAHVVCAHDLFEYELGLDVRLRHVPVQDGERGDVRAAYAVADLDGIRQFEVMSRAEIEAVRARSRAGKSGPWVTDFAEMAKKTVVRRLFKYLPKTLQMIELLEADNEDYAPPSSAADVIDVQGSPANGAQAQVRAALAATAPAAEPAPATFSPEEAERQGRKARLEVLWANERAACEAVGMRTLKGIASGSLDSINERIARIEAEVGRRKQRAAEPPPPERYEREPGDEEPEDDELPFGGAPAPEHP